LSACFICYALQGIGGAGLYSDGKLSFFPSSTELWLLPDQKALKQVSLIVLEVKA